MRVLLVHNRYRSAQPSGENAVVEDEAGFLERAGCSVHRLETSSDEIAAWPLAKRALLPGRVVWSREGYRLVETAIRDVRPDVVHAHNTFPLLSPAALWAARRSGVRVVQTLHNFRPLCVAGSFYTRGRVCEACLGRGPLPGLVRGCYRDSRAASLPLVVADGVHGRLRTWERCVDVFFTPSAFTRRKYIAAGWPREKLVVKPNTAPDPGPRPHAWHGEFAYVGRAGHEKGTDVLLAAWARAFPEGGPGLRMIGPDGETAAGLPGVRAFGRVERSCVLELLAGARALIVPSQVYEVFPRVIVEAYALGVPVVASDLGPLPELVEDGTTGRVVETGSADGLARALLSLGSDDAARRLGRNARLAYERLYAPGPTTRRLLEIYAGGASAAAAAA